MQGCSYMPGLGAAARIRWGSRILLAGWRAAYLQALTGAVVVAGLNMALTAPTEGVLNKPPIAP